MRTAICAYTAQITCVFDEILTSGPQDTYEGNACGSFSFFPYFFTNNPNLENPSSGITRPKKTKKNIAIMVVYICGTGCQLFVENDHAFGCAASVEHTLHPLGRPSSHSSRRISCGIFIILL